MLWWIIPLIILVLSLALLIGLLVRKLPAVRVLDVESIPQEKNRRLKEQLVMQRVDRMRSQKLGGISKAAGGAVGAVSKVGRRAVQRLYAMEQYYEKLKKAPAGEAHPYDAETVKQMIEEAEQFVREGEVIPAEKRYIEIISHSPRNVEAYEGLGNLYLHNKQYDQARETLSFVLRLDPKNASIHMSLAELETKQGNTAAALEQSKKAVDLSPKNPKYLDMYIESALAAKQKDEVRRGLQLMREVNEENTKLKAWDTAFKKL